MSVIAGPDQKHRTREPVSVVWGSRSSLQLVEGGKIEGFRARKGSPVTLGSTARREQSLSETAPSRLSRDDLGNQAVQIV